MRFTNQLTAALWHLRGDRDDADEDDSKEQFHTCRFQQLELT